MPAVVLVLLSGLWLVLAGSEWQLGQLWVLIALAGFAGAFLVGVLYLSRTAGELERAARPTSPPPAKPSVTGCEGIRGPGHPARRGLGHGRQARALSAPKHLPMPELGNVSLQERTVTSGFGATLDREILVLGGVVVLGAIMTVLDLTIVNVAIPTLAKAFSASVATIQWVATGYMLAVASAIPLSGWASERFGAKRVWITSLVLFLAGSALSGAAWSSSR